MKEIIGIIREELKSKAEVSGVWEAYEVKEYILEIERDLVAKIEALNIACVSGSTDIPKPYAWLKEGKFKIAEGATYHDPRATITQCAGWITEYVKKYYR